MAHRSRLKVLLFLVEGATDKTSLGLAMSRLLSQSDIRFEIMDGDLTADFHIPTTDIVKEVGNRVRDFAGRQHFEAKDFYKVVQIIDTDAAFIPDTQVLDMTGNPELSDYGKGVYYDPASGICARNPGSVIYRNHLKQAKVNRLRTCAKIYRSIPYELYYMSMNLEHVFYNVPNASRDEKVSWANQLEDILVENPQQLVHFIKSPKIALGGNDYTGSWEFIETGANSLKRCSNFNVFFEKAEQDGILVC